MGNCCLKKKKDKYIDPESDPNANKKPEVKIKIEEFNDTYQAMTQHKLISQSVKDKQYSSFPPISNQITSEKNGMVINPQNQIELSKRQYQTPDRSLGASRVPYYSPASDKDSKLFKLSPQSLVSKPPPNLKYSFSIEILNEGNYLKLDIDQSTHFGRILDSIEQLKTYLDEDLWPHNKIIVQFNNIQTTYQTIKNKTIKNNSLGLVFAPKSQQQQSSPNKIKIFKSEQKFNFQLSSSNIRVPIQQLNVPGSWQFSRMLNNFRGYQGQFERLNEKQQLGTGIGLKKGSSTYYRLKNQVIQNWAEKYSFDAVEKNPQLINNLLLFSNEIGGDIEDIQKEEETVLL